MEKTHKIDVVSIRLVEEPPLYSSKELKNPCDVAELFQDFLKDCDREIVYWFTQEKYSNLRFYPMPAVSFWHITTLPVIQNQAGMI